MRMSQAQNEKSWQRLPTNVVPSHYILKLQPDLEAFTFVGEESVCVEVKETSPEIVLNAADLAISSIKWQDAANSSHDISWNVDDNHETLLIKFVPPLSPGEGILSFSFLGTLNDKLKGFYRSKYTDSTGAEHFNAVTQFEATDARRAFPCWDEPAIRATFDITLVAPKNKVALSNMPVKASRPFASGSNLVEYDFERTPSMSTYLIAFVVGDFDYIEDTTSDGTLCRVYTPVGKKDQGRYALDVAVRVLPYYKDYFGIGYTLPKIDLIAIADFAIGMKKIKDYLFQHALKVQPDWNEALQYSCSAALTNNPEGLIFYENQMLKIAGAMENWGLVTYRETRLLVDEIETSAVNRQHVALVVGHELAHQWFGNLVALEWWTHLWLKEGYASFIEFLCVDHLFPEYDIWTQFVTETLTEALELDALENSHPIEIPVSHPSEIDEIFDTISYNKGSAIIRMLHNFVGMETFKKGMNLYLTRHQYGNASTEDLWTALSEASGKPIGDIMSTWTKQMGFPVVTVSQRQVGSSRILTLTQRKFVANQMSTSSADNDGYLWMIPLTFSTSRNPDQVEKEILMDKRTFEVVFENMTEDDWIKINPGTVGYYRVSYSPDMLKQFVPAIRSKILPALDRLGIIDDLFALAQCGEKSVIQVLELLEAYTQEDNLTVWTCVNKILSRLHLLLDGTDCFETFKAFGKSLLHDMTERVGWMPRQNETHLDAMLRSLILNRMVSLGDSGVTKEAKKKFEDHLKGVAKIPSDLRNPIYRAVLSEGDEKTFQRVLLLYRESDTSEEKDRIGRALGAIKNSDILRQAVHFATSEEVRSQDTVIFMISIGMSHVGRQIIWEYFKDNFEFFRDRYKTNRFVSYLVKYVLENFKDLSTATEIEAFFEKNHFPGTERAVRQACESIRLNNQWMSRNLPEVANFLSKKTVS